MKNQKGITLIGLVITIIVLIILASIGIGASVSMVENVDKSQNTTAIADLNKIQQAIFEIYTVYMQTKNSNVLIGTKMSYAEAQEVEQEFQNLENGSEVSLKASASENEIECYYKLNKKQIEELGMQNVKNTQEYVINYSTGEVFNTTLKKSEKGTILYISK